MQSTEPIIGSRGAAPSVAQAERNQAAIDLLRAWREEGDADEQRETGLYLMRALAEDDILIGRAPNGDRA